MASDGLQDLVGETPPWFLFNPNSLVPSLSFQDASKRTTSSDDMSGETRSNIENVEPSEDVTSRRAPS